MIRKLLLCTALLAAGALLSWQELERRWLQPLALPVEGRELIVAPGQSLRAVADGLHRDGVLKYPDLLVLYARWKGVDQQIKRGEYLLPAGLSAPELLALLQSGKVITYQVTLPEGITLQQALSILSVQQKLDASVVDPNDPALLALVQPFAQPEGLFFPDTYHYSRGTSDLELLEQSHKRLLDVLSQEWEGRAPDLPYETPYEALVMASIIERETGLPEEREEIAGVFVRRLQQGMRLQTDPTVIYGVGSAFDGDLRRSHLADESNLYNTYRIDGLPPTPIALAGRASIHAALHPAEGSSLFFVARGDGGHVFTATLAEHEAAVRKYQLQRRSDYRSSPEPAK